MAKSSDTMTLRGCNSSVEDVPKWMVQDQHATRGKADTGRPDGGGRSGRNRFREGRRPLPTIPPAKRRFLRILWRHCAATRRRPHSSSPSIKRTAAIAYRLQTAKKPQTKRRRMEVILAMLARGDVLDSVQATTDSMENFRSSLK